MKSSGMVRKVDELGRIVIPIEIRQTLDIKVKTPLEIFVDEDMIVLRKYQPACIFCGGTKDIVFFNDKKICSECLEKIKTQL